MTYESPLLIESSSRRPANAEDVSFRLPDFPDEGVAADSFNFEWYFSTWKKKKRISGQGFLYGKIFFIIVFFGGWQNLKYLLKDKPLAPWQGAYNAPLLENPPVGSWETWTLRSHGYCVHFQCWWNSARVDFFFKPKFPCHLNISRARGIIRISTTKKVAKNKHLPINHREHTISLRAWDYSEIWQHRPQAGRKWKYLLCLLFLAVAKHVTHVHKVYQVYIKTIHLYQGIKRLHPPANYDL